MSEQQKLCITLHNSKVTESRKILKCLIKTTCFLAKQELAFRGNNESQNSFNRGNYVELIYAFAENDQRLARHFKTSSVFSGLSNRIQNDLIESVAEVKATPNGNPSDDFYWRQKSSSLNVVQYNTTSRPIIIHLQIYIA